MSNFFIRRTMKNSHGIVEYNTKSGKRFKTQVQINKVKYRRSFKTKKEAISWKKQMKQRAEDNKDYGSRFKDGLTINDIFIEFEASRIDKKEQTLRTYKHLYNLYIGPILGKTQLFKVQIRDIDILKKYLIERELSNSTINTIFALLKAIFNLATQREYTNRNLSLLIKKVKVQKNDYEYWKEHQVNKFLNKIEDEFYYSLIAFAFHTGLRRGELIALTWNDLDYKKEKAYLDIKRQITQDGSVATLKGNSARILPLNREAIKILEKLHSNSKQNGNKGALLFTTKRGKAINPNNLSKDWKKLQQKHGVEKPIKFHAIRHSFATNMARNGLDLRMVQKLLGHSSVQVTERYDHFDVNQLFENF